MFGRLRNTGNAYLGYGSRVILLRFLHSTRERGVKMEERKGIDNKSIISIWKMHSLTYRSACWALSCILHREGEIWLNRHVLPMGDYNTIHIISIVVLFAILRRARSSINLRKLFQLVYSLTILISPLFSLSLSLSSLWCIVAKHLFLLFPLVLSLTILNLSFIFSLSHLCGALLHNTYFIAWEESTAI